MTERAYITVDRAESPRLIEIAEVGAGGSDAVAMQDLHDTLNSNTLPAGDSDDSLASMDDDFLIASAGKEDLGDGVLVGITATLQNAQIAFAGNYVPAQTGIATSVDSGGTLLTDTGAQFEVNGVIRGDWIVNFDDRSVTEVLIVISDTQLRHQPLQSGVNDDWEIGDEYAVFHIVQKEIAGGNIVANDTGGSPISAIFPRFATQVVRTSSASATLKEQADVEYASFNGGVTIDVSSSYSGTVFPTGTQRQPVNNIDDAMTIAGDRGFTVLFIVGDIALDTACSCHGFTLIGESISKTRVTIEAAADVEHAEFSIATITGVLDGGNVLSNCALETLEFVDGVVERCVLQGVITLSTVENAHFMDCWSGVPGLTTPVIDMGGSGSALGIRNYNGGITLRNKTGSEAVSIDMNSGQVILEDSVTKGDIVLRGVGIWTNKDTYAGGANVIDQLLSPDNITGTLNATLYDGKTFAELQAIVLAMAQGRIRETGLGTNVFEFFAQNNSTVLYTLTKTATERQRS